MAPRNWQKALTELICCLQVLAVGCLLVSSVLWWWTVGGKSIVLLSLVALMGNIGCMSSVTYFAYAVPFPAACTKALSLGTALGGLGTTALAALQMGGRPQDSPRFGASSFFLVAATVQVTCCIAFATTSKTISSPQAKNGDAELQNGANKKDDVRAVAVGKRQLDEETELDDLESEPSIRSTTNLIADTDGGDKPPVQQKVLSPSQRWRAEVPLLCIMFVIYAAAYTLPTFLPYAAKGYVEQTGQAVYKQQMLLRLIISQTVGDVSGRLGTGFIPKDMSSWAKRNLLISSGIVLTATFAGILSATINPALLANLSYTIALWTLSLAVFIFYVARGFLVTFMYLVARGMWPEVEASTSLSTNLGFYGQMGALTANILLFIITSL